MKTFNFGDKVKFKEKPTNFIPDDTEFFVSSLIGESLGMIELVARRNGVAKDLGWTDIKNLE